MFRPSRRLLHALAALCLVAAGAAACGGNDGTDLAGTCAAVRKAFPPTLYDDGDNARFARRLERILDKAEPEARSAFGPMDRRLQAVVEAAGDNEAVVTANVELLDAIQDVNGRCREAGAEPVHPVG